MITNADREKIITHVVAYGMKQTDAAKKLGYTPATTSAVVRIFNAVKEQNWEYATELVVGHHQSLSAIEWAADRVGVKVPKELYAADKEAREKRKAQDPKKEEPETKPVTQLEAQKVHIPAGTAEMGWQTRIKVKPKQLCMTVYFNGMPVVEGYSNIRGDKELDLMQAISYAAHMCYKIAEQKKMRGAK